jgi:hypothetical protein
MSKPKPQPKPCSACGNVNCPGPHYCCYPWGAVALEALR